MEPIKINVSVELNLSQVTKDFILSVFNGTVATAAPAAKPAPQPAASAKPATQAPAAHAKPAAKPATQAPASEISIEDVRKALSLKVNDHRAEIKDKLNELGAPSVTKLDPANYQEMLDFLNSLS